MDYRQRLVDATVAELKAQRGGEWVSQDGTEVFVEGSIKMARVVEAVVGNAFADDDDALLNTVIAMFPPEKGRLFERHWEATDLLWDLRAVMMKRLDPLP